MLFNSYPFLLLFLPITVAGFFLLARRSEVLAAAWLGAASLAFYGWWDVRYVPLLLGSIGFNFWAGMNISRAGASTRKPWLAGAIAANLLLLGYFKYANFFIGTAAWVAGTNLGPLDIVLPLGISFFTFTQIAFLVDTYYGKVTEYRFVHYLLFVTYFPHLIAGPVLHHKEMMPQFGDSRNYVPRAEHFAVGLSIFVVGLAKKVLIADNLAPMANALFEPGQSPSLLQAWVGVVAYTLQLYFDFSGYSDMAIGLSRLFGVRLPLNFNSPYQAENIVEFWRRWHMTLSRFLRDYLYIPLGGNRHGTASRYRNLMLTMVLGGLWHGAGWTYVLWGALHGFYLVVNHLWQHLRTLWGFDRSCGLPGRIAARAVTLLAVMVAWVFFRAPDMATALEVLQAMVGLNGVVVPESFGGIAPSLGLSPAAIRWVAAGEANFLVLLFAVVAALFAPNTQQIFAAYAPALETAAERARWVIRWRPNAVWGLLTAVLAVACILSLDRVTEFLYFQF